MSTPGKSDFLSRSMRYCSGAERCTQDVVKKLVSWEAPEEEFETILETLRKEKFLDDTRYAHSYVADKWRLDQWGKVKIRNGLFQKGISEALIEMAIETIDLEGYTAILHHLLMKKRESIKRESTTSQMQKLLSFGASRGFEEELIWSWMERERVRE
jgi:regulatory protein